MRSFVAINLPRAIKDDVDAISERLRTTGPPARWVPGENLHLTLKFLDEIEDRQIDPIGVALAKACQDVNPFEIRLNGFGVFPNERKARVFWLGVELGADTLRTVAERIDRELHPLGFVREQRPFSAHITLARFREPSPVNRLMQEALRFSYQSEAIRVERVDLMKSVLSAKGAQYSVVSSVKLI